MRENENQSNGSIFNAWKVFSKLYNALYCSRAKVSKDPENECRTAKFPGDVPIEEENITDLSSAAVAEEGLDYVPESEPHEQQISWFEEVKNQQIDKVKELIEKGANINETDENGWSALHIAAWNNYCSLCQQLITSGADINLPGPGNSSPLSLAAQCGHYEIVNILIQAKCNIMQTADLADNFKVSALHLAAQYGHSEVVKLLIEAGAVVNSTMTVRDINGVTPLHLAVENEHLDVMDILIAAGCDVHSSTQPQSQDDPVAQETSQINNGNEMESSC